MTRAEIMSGLGPEGLDAVMSEDEAERYAGPFLPDDSEPVTGYGTYVLCDGGQHLVREGEVCAGCHHGCSNPNDPACPGNEETSHG